MQKQKMRAVPYEPTWESLQQYSVPPWFMDAKLGIFIHAGIYSVKGIGESWSFHNKQISYQDYMSQLKGFTNKNYDPSNWADLIQESGARF